MLNTYIDIPDDIVIEILSRLPAKSLLRLRWACKYLFDLITRDRAFIKKQCLHHHTTNPNDDVDDARMINNTSIMLYDYSNLPVVYTMNLGDMINNHDDEDVDVNMDGNNFHRLCTFVGNCPGFYVSCNGLILLFFNRKNGLHNKHFLWNPCTGEFKNLPYEPIHSSNDNIEYNFFGFGYDQTNDDYKVLKINKSNLLNDNLNMEIGIYTVGSNSWRTKILAVPLVKAHWKKLRGFGLFHNGALNWIIHLQQTSTIVSFDMTKEELRDIEVPNSILRYCLSLEVLNGCLCTSQWSRSALDGGKTLVIWIMKEYGMKDSWSKLFSINMEKVVVDARSHPYYTLEPFNLYLKDGGIVILTSRKVIAACDSKKNDKARFIYSIRDYENRFVVANYIESLVSLNSGKYSTLVGSRTTTVTKQDLLEYEVVDGCLVKISQQQN